MDLGRQDLGARQSGASVENETKVRFNSTEIVAEIVGQQLQAAKTPRPLLVIQFNFAMISLNFALEGEPNTSATLLCAPMADTAERSPMAQVAPAGPRSALAGRRVSRSQFDGRVKAAGQSNANLRLAALGCVIERT